MSESKGYDPPNYTQIPNVFLDSQMPKISSMAELKVTLAVMRQTFGWHKDEDRISVTQLENLTGLSRPSVTEGLKAALAHKVITRRKAGQGYVYRLNVKDLYTENGEGKKATSKESKPVTSKESEPEVVKNLNPQKKGKKEKETPTESTASAVAEESEDVKKLEPKPVPIEKYYTTEFYHRIKERYGVQLRQDQFGFHISQFKRMLKQYSPSDEEIERVLAHMVEKYPSAPKMDALTAIQDVRLGRDTGEAWEGDAPWEKAKKSKEQLNPHSDEAEKQKDSIRRPEWYAAAFDLLISEVEDLIKVSSTHSEMLAQIERNSANG